MKLTYKSIIILMGWMCELHTVQKSLTHCTKTEPVTVRADAMYSVYIVKVCIYIPVYLAFVYICTYLAQKPDIYRCICSVWVTGSFLYRYSDIFWTMQFVQGFLQKWPPKKWSIS